MAPKYRDTKNDPFVNMNENFKNHAEEILESLGLFLGLDDLEFGEEDDTCILQLDEKIQVNITLNSTNDTIILHHQMGTLPGSDRSEIVEQLLEANLFWSGTNGATISMDRDTGLVIIALALAIYTSDGKILTGEALGEAIADLANTATIWKTVLENKNVETDDSESISRMIQEAGGHQPLDITTLD